MVERDRLLSGYWGITQSGVRIPPSPLKAAFYAVFFYAMKRDSENPLICRILLINTKVIKQIWSLKEELSRIPLMRMRHELKSYRGRAACKGK